MWKSMVCPGSSEASQIRTCSLSRTTRWPTLPSLMPRAAAVFTPVVSVIKNSRCGTPPSLRKDRDGVDLDQIVRRYHLGDLDHGRGRQRRRKILAPHFVDG